MSLRLSRLSLSHLATGLLFLAAVLLVARHCYAIYYALGPSKDEWGLKYEVEVSETEGGKLNVVFNLTNEGRLKPIYSATVIASTDPDRNGFQSYLVNSRIDLNSTKDGKLAGQVQMRKEFIDRAMIRILTLTVDGRHQSSGARYYDIPLKKFLKKAPVAASPPESASIASPPATNVKK